MRRRAGVARALLRAYWVDDRDISNPDVAAAAAGAAGVDVAAARAVVDDPAMEGRAEARGRDGRSRGVFGSPFVFADDEPFWGLDRFDQLDWFLGSSADRAGRVRAVSHVRLIVADLEAAIGVLPARAGRGAGRERARTPTPSSTRPARVSRS